MDKKIYLLAILALLIALMPMPYGYYTLLRLIVTIVALAKSYQFYSQEKTSYKTIALFIIALLYNPIIVVHLSREIWIPINIITAIIFVAAYFAENTSLNNHRDK